MRNKNKDTHKDSKANIHDEEHKKWNRRSFIQALGLVGGGTMMLGSTPLTASRPSPLAVALSQSESDRILVLIRLKGGNDGLNTIIPIYDYDVYANLRPSLKHDLSNITNLSSDFGIPTFMNSLEPLWGNGAMKVVHGVGYNDGSLSHFSGSDIWASTDGNDVERTGWLGRYFEDLYPDYTVNPPAIPAAVQIGSVGNLIFDGLDNNYAFSVANPQQLENIANNGTLYNVTDLPECTYGNHLGFLRSTTNTTFNYAGVISEAYMSVENSVSYPDTDISRQLANVARMIKGDLGTKVYMVSLGGFDTHANQKDKHQELLTNLSNAVKLFFDDLATSGHDQDTLAMTFSEFGRRPDENGSQGTDHGAAAPLLLFGPGLQGNGFIGNHPSLTTLNNDGNLIYDIDFREIYATIMQEWLCINPVIVNQALLGQDYNRLDIGFNCNSLSVDDYNLSNSFTHLVLYDNNKTLIKIKNPNTQHTVVKLYDIIGREVATLKNEMLFAGDHTIDVKKESQTRLSTGQYIYRISVGDQHYSRSMILR